MTFPFPTLSTLAALALALLAGCSTMPTAKPREPSTVLTDTSGTRLARVAKASLPAAAAATAAQPTAVSASDPAAVNTVSGFRLLAAGEEAYGALYTLITSAERSLDLQYYIIKDDPYSRALLRAARAAADRGVRVRVLIDDIYTTGKDDRIAWYSSHPNVQVRLFNPFANGRPTMATRILTSLTDIGRINRRMHNKLFVADNAFAVTGGRNMGAEYYQHSKGTNFLDLDVLAAGPVVADLSQTYDRYWNSPYAVPIEQLVDAGASKRGVVAPEAADPVAIAIVEAEKAGESLADQIATGRVPMTPALADLYADRPTKVGSTAPKTVDGQVVVGQTIATDVLALVENAKSEVVIVSPYFVPGERGVRILGSLVERGVDVRVITNSLAATDAAVVHIGYSKYREPLLRAGVRLFELRPEPGTEGTRLTAVGSSKASLHAKAVVIDRRTLFVGSYNVDPRSTLINTEMGIEINSESLAAEVLEILRRRGEESRYQLVLDGGGLHWVTRIDGAERVFVNEPDASPLLKFTLKVLAPFAPEKML